MIVDKFLFYHMTKIIRERSQFKWLPFIARPVQMSHQNWIEKKKIGSDLDVLHFNRNRHIPRKGNKYNFQNKSQMIYLCWLIKSIFPPFLWIQTAMQTNGTHAWLWIHMHRHLMATINVFKISAKPGTNYNVYEQILEIAFYYVNK